MARIYLETTIFSFYYEARTEPDMVARFDHIRRVNGILGLVAPSLVTPLELLAEELRDD